MKREPAPLARPTTQARFEGSPRRGEFTSAERRDVAWLLEDYAEVLETCALGLGEATDADTMDRVNRARDFANRLK